MTRAPTNPIATAVQRRAHRLAQDQRRHRGQEDRQRGAQRDRLRHRDLRQRIEIGDDGEIGEQRAEAEQCQVPGREDPPRPRPAAAEHQRQQQHETEEGAVEGDVAGRQAIGERADADRHRDEHHDRAERVRGRDPGDRRGPGGHGSGRLDRCGLDLHVNRLRRAPARAFAARRGAPAGTRWRRSWPCRRRRRAAAPGRTASRRRKRPAARARTRTG